MITALILSVFTSVSWRAEAIIVDTNQIISINTNKEPGFYIGSWACLLQPQKTENLFEDEEDAKIDTLKVHCILNEKNVKDSTKNNKKPLARITMSTTCASGQVENSVMQSFIDFQDGELNFQLSDYRTTNAKYGVQYNIKITCERPKNKSVTP